ncbi:MAG TPA: hypothetical protein VLM75_03375 [Spirochaetota bacterium]|nr:hypothetical protein [Spirochaetota bacterium]
MDVFIDAFAAAQKAHRAADPRAIFVHAQTVRADQLDRAGKLGMPPRFSRPTSITGATAIEKFSWARNARPASARRGQL